MDDYELLPTHDNLLQTYMNDSIGRNKDVWAFADILDSISGPCSIALDGKWGSGKTFFVKQVKMFLDANNPNLPGMTDWERQQIQLPWGRSFRKRESSYQPQVCVYYDAWECDNDEDPVLSLVYAILNSVDTDFTFKTDTDIFAVASSILEFFSGRSLKKVKDSFAQEDPLAAIRKSRNIEEKVKEFLDQLLPERGNRLVVFVDELDRCKPDYAVRLLERIKHYFSNERITFVFSINSAELQHTIKRYYGDDFDACRYLDRFFDLRKPIPNADMKAFYRTLAFKETGHLYNVMRQKAIEHFAFSLRETAKFLRMTKVAAQNAMQNDQILFGDEKGLRSAILYLLPIAIGLFMTDTNLFREFIDGRNDNPIRSFYTFGNTHSISWLLASNETFYSSSNGKTSVKLVDKILALYDAVFGSYASVDGGVIEIGECEFTAETKKQFIEIIGLASRYTDMNYFVVT